MVGQMTLRGWRRSADVLHARGWRTITPYPRGFGPTRFLSDDTVRPERGVALAQDALDLADALDLKTFAVAGHD
jgi:pimeloyl-ACP methyl ester carboxylesterase